jgi:hypothetical protein
MMWKIPLDQDALTLVIAAAISAVGISLAPSEQRRTAISLVPDLITFHNT